MKFSEKVVAITGAGTGIGKAAAHAFFEAGAAVVLNGRREAVLAEVARELDPSGKRVALVAGDIGTAATAQSLARTAASRFGGLDALVNAAGIFTPMTFADHTEEAFDRYVHTILKGTFLASQAAVPHLAARGGGAIVNVGSMWAMQALAATPCAAYSAAKAGVHALTKNLAIELASKQIRVNTVAPAVIATPVYESFIPRAQVEGALASFAPLHPLGRIGQTSDIVPAIVFLASSDAAWITGTVLPVDGGVMAGRN